MSRPSNPLHHIDDFSRPALRRGSLNSLSREALYLSPRQVIQVHPSQSPRNVRAASYRSSGTSFAAPSLSDVDPQSLDNKTSPEHNVLFRGATWHAARTPSAEEVQPCEEGRERGRETALPSEEGREREIDGEGGRLPSALLRGATWHSANTPAAGEVLSTLNTHQNSTLHSKHCTLTLHTEHCTSQKYTLNTQHSTINNQQSAINNQ